MKQFHLMPQPSGHCTGYDARINPAILNEFASAAFRWHTLVHVSLIAFVDLLYCPGRVAIDEVELNHSFSIDRMAITGAVQSLSMASH